MYHQSAHIDGLSPSEYALLHDVLKTQSATDPEGLRALHGGRTSRVWRMQRPSGPPIVAKLSRQSDGTTLFPNQPALEWAALLRLTEAGLSPVPIAAGYGAPGTWVLLSQGADAPGATDPASLASLLVRIHSQPPWDTLPRLPMEPDSILRHGDAMLQQAPGTKWLEALRPQPPKQLIPMDRRLVHRDLVPANTAAISGGLIALDWQCPAFGDPAEDLAHASSPAMQSLAPEAPRIPGQALVAAYPDPAIRARFRQMAPAYRWRMACYCHLQASAVDKAYAAALDLECAALEQARQEADTERCGDA